MNGPGPYLLAFTAIGLLVFALYRGEGEEEGRATVTIATVNNRDMTVMQRLSPHFEAENPDVRLEWLVLEENILRQRVTTDIAVGGGQFDVITSGTYETPIWGRLGWLRPMDDLRGSDAFIGEVEAAWKDLAAQGTRAALAVYLRDAESESRHGAGFT